MTNKNLKKRIMALSLASTMLLTAGCSKQKDKPLLSGTILENAYLAQFDDKKMVVIYEGNYSHTFSDVAHKHYKDIVTGLTIASEECLVANTTNYKDYQFISHVATSLTEEEILAAKTGELTDK